MHTDDAINSKCHIALFLFVRYVKIVGHIKPGEVSTVVRGIFADLSASEA